MIKLLNKYKILGLPILIIVLTLIVNWKPIRLESNASTPVNMEWDPQIQIVEESNALIEEKIIKEIKEIPIYICGQVNNPGVYYVLDNALLYELIDLAGGFTEEADPEGINLARQVVSNEKIVVPKQGEKIDKTINSYENVEYGKRLININTAIESELEDLPGIGAVKAKQIVEYRTSNGVFKTPEEIKNVPGIGDKTFNSLKDMITIE